MKCSPTKVHFYFFIIVLGLTLAVPTPIMQAKEEKAAADNKAATEKKPEKKASASNEKPPAPVIEGPDAANALGTSAPTRYVHQWLPMPQVVATNLNTLETLILRPRPGRMMVVFFLASWCEPCQNLAAALQSLTRSLAQLPIDTYFVFAHDTVDDAKGFITEHSIQEGYLAELDTLKNYNNPELPTVYIADRQGWLLTRFLKATPQNVAEVKRILQLLTAF